MKENRGIFYPDGSYANRDEIRRKLLADFLDGGTKRVDKVEVTSRSFDDWTKIITRQQDERKELLEIPEAVSVKIKASKKVPIVLFGDIHAGGSDVDYKSFARDVDLTKRMKAYVITAGDLTDSYFFMPEVGEEIIAGDEQILYAQTALDEVSKGGKLLAAWGGDHDMWSKDKSGAHTLYARFKERYNAHYLEGISYLTVNVDNGKNVLPYKIIGSHQHRGFSVYNDVHAAWRQFNDEAKTDTDIISFTAHKHTKGYLHQVRKSYGGDEINIHAISLGTYKESDRYSRKKGFARTGAPVLPEVLPS